MRAMAIQDYGGPDVIAAVDLPMPEPAPDEVLVRIRAVGVNPADWKWRSGMFAAQAPIRFPHVLGYDIAGEVVHGAGFSPGDRVAAMLDPFVKGGYAEYVAVAADRLAPIPHRLSFDAAAACPTAGLTGTQMVEALETGTADTLLVTGATGAVGRFVLLAARRRGIRTVAAVRRHQIAEALALGSDRAIDISADWQGPGLDHLIDTVGGAQAGQLCRHVRPGGTILTAATTPIEAEALPVAPHFFTIQPSGADLQRLFDLMLEEKFEVPIVQILPLAEAGRAQHLVEQGGLGGKIILRP